MSNARNQLLTPKDLADAIGVSESALRRWVDAGRIAMSRTAGGHRRILLQDAIRFIRRTGATVVRPELLGLGALVPSSVDSDADALYESLVAGDRDAVCRQITSKFMEGVSLHALFDGPLRLAFARIGELWQHDQRGILVEHRATAIAIQAVAELRRLLPDAGEAAPVALGGAPEGDPYQLPTMLAGAVLAECGFKEVDYGPQVPLALLAAEAKAAGARLVWLSVTFAPDPAALFTSVRKLARSLADSRIDLIVGGRAAAACAPRELPNVAFGSTLGELASRAAAVRASLSL